jgi:hypothetical protein
MRLNRYNWQELETGAQVDPSWLPELLSRRDVGQATAVEAAPVWGLGDSRMALVQQNGSKLALIGSVTGLELLQQWQVDGLPEWFVEADEYQVMLANPFSEELKRQVYYQSTDPRGLADKMHAEIVDVIRFLKGLVADGRCLQLKFYNGVAGLSQWMFDSIESFAAVREWSSRFQLAWQDHKVGQFDFTSGNMVFLQPDGRIGRRINFDNPPRLPYFDAEGALVISF